jgi:hypothetical protein
MIVIELLHLIIRGLETGQLHLNGEIRVADLGYGGFNKSAVSTSAEHGLDFEPIAPSDEEEES